MRDLKVGVFVLMGLFFTGLVVFLIGDERRVFDRAHEYQTSFEDVDGLKTGGPVRMGGVRVGQVTAVRYGNAERKLPGGDAEDPSRIYVEFSVVQESAGLVRQDSTIAVSNKGLLGDKMLVLKKGVKGEALKDGAVVPGVKENGLFERFDQLSVKAESAMGNVDLLAENLANEQLHRDLRTTVAQLGALLKNLNEGKGYPNRFLTDEKEADRISRIVANLDRSSVELAQTMREVRLAVRQVRTGPGFAHALLFSEQPPKQVLQFGNAAEEFATTLKAVRNGDGVAKELLFGGNKNGTKDAMTNLTAMTADLRVIVHNIRKGKGTIGALLVDPSIYEDVKRLVGDVERNAVLRSLVRYSIRQDRKLKKPTVSKRLEPPTEKTVDRPVDQPVDQPVDKPVENKAP